MTFVAYRTRGRRIRRVPGDELSRVKKGQRPSPTTTIERLLLMTMIVTFVLEPYLPGVPGFSATFIMFAISAGYVLLHRPGALAKTWSHPVFLVAFGFLLLGTLIESVHPLSRYKDIVRMGQMFVGAISVASLCRDRRALHTSIYGVLIAGVLMSILLFLTVYGTLQQATATDFSEASKLRNDAFADVEASRTAMLFPAQAAAVALALGLSARSSLRRNLFLGITLVCVVGAFLPMSRGGIIMVGASCATVMFAYGIRHVKVILIAAVLAVGVLIWVPEAVFSRFTLTPETAPGRIDSRTRVYKAAIDYLPEYVLTGVGAGNFWESWGMQTDYYTQSGKRRGGVRGAHNAFIQVTEYWGLAALLMLIMVVYLTYRSLPRGGKDVLALCLYGIAVCLLLQMMVGHALYSKTYSLGLGLMVGGRLWIWPNGIVPSLRHGQSRPYRTPEQAS